MRTLTIEDMIKQGASWKDIEARVKEIQLEEAARKAAAEKAKKEKERAKKAQTIEVARKRFIAAFADLMIATGTLPEQEKEEFCAAMSKELTAEMLLFAPFMMR